MTADKEIILKIIEEIQKLIPEEIIKQLMIERINKNNIDNYIASYTSVFSPIYLPILEKDSNLFGIHLEPEKCWYECPWVMVPHDSQEVDTIASSFRYLPYAFFTSALNMGNYVEEIISPVSSMLDSNSDFLNTEFIMESIEVDRRLITEKYDIADGASQLSMKTKFLFDDESIEITEDLLKKYPDDILCIFAATYLRLKLKHQKSGILFEKIITSECYKKNIIYYISGITSSPQILETIREHALKGLPDDSPFQKMKDTPYISAAAVPILKEIAEDFHNMGEEQLALNQLRNAAMIEGVYGNGMTKEWCLELAEQCDRVEKNSLAGALARYAAEVVHLGP